MPVYLQLIEQVKHAVATGALRAGEQLPGLRRLAEDLVINPNTVAKAYHELERDGWIEVRHGAGAFVAARVDDHARIELLSDAAARVRSLVDQLREAGVSDAELRRLLESALTRRAVDPETSVR